LLVCNLVQPISLNRHHDLRPKDVATARHLRLPLRVSANRSGTTIVGELIEQIEAIRALAQRPESP
jgi:hypothetical protein